MEHLTHAGAVVVRESDGAPEYLLVSARNKPDERVLPKGHIMPGEAPEAAALRELREEAGVEGRILSLLGVHEFTVGSERIRAAYYLVEYVRDVAAEEARQMSWCGYEEGLRRTAHAEVRASIEAAHTEWRRIAEGGGRR